MSEGQLPELVALAHAVRKFDQHGGKDVDLRNGGNLIDGICRKIYGQHYYRYDGWSRAESRDQGHKVEPTLVSRSILPLPPAGSINFITNILQKTTLYSDLTVLVCPYTVRYFGSRLSSGRHDWDPEVADILNANAPFCSLLERGRCVFLPEHCITELEMSIVTDTVECSAPVRQTSSRLEFLPLNTSLDIPTPQRDLFLLETVMLPYFPNASLQLIADVASKETDSFIRFTHYLASRIADIGAAPDARDLERIVAEIRDEAVALRFEAKKLASMRAFRKVEMATFAISIVALLFSAIGALQSLAAITGGATLLQIARGHFQAREAMLDIKKSQFYIPYVIDKD